ncbi:MAG: hypothetical protein K6A62_05840 [Bacteroidales bacterium]|nr:hypothetical protein [Bacteroidales bacterium]
MMKRNKNQDWTRVLQERLQDAQLPAPDDFASWAGQKSPENSGHSWPVAWWPWALGSVAVAAFAGLLFLRTPDNHSRLNPQTPPVVVESPAVVDSPAPTTSFQASSPSFAGSTGESPAPAPSFAAPSSSFAGLTGESPAAPTVIPAEEPESPSPASATPDEPSASTTSIASPSIADPAPSFDDLIGEAPARRKPHLSLRLHAASVNTVSAGSSTVNMGKRTEYYLGAKIPDGVVSSPGTEKSEFYSSDLSSNIINPVPVPRAPTIPISFGASAELSLSRHWSLLAGLDYTQRSGYRVYERAPQSLTLHYLGLPLEAHYIFWPEGRFRVYLGAGAKVEKCFLATGGEPLKDPFLFSLNVQAGADVRLFPGIRLYLSPVFSGYLTRSAYVNSWDSKPQFSLRAGLSFDL